MFGSLHHIGQVNIVVCFPSIRMRLRMIARTMTLFPYSFIDHWVSNDVIADTKKSCFRLILFKLIQNKGCSQGVLVHHRM